MSAHNLTAKQEMFVVEYLKDLNATQAAVRAGYAPGHGAEVEGSRLLRNAEVKAAIDVELDGRKDRVQVSADDVLRELWGQASADANELVEFRRRCCRHCWGEDHRYQSTPAERASRFGQYEQDGLNLVESFDELGGIGFDARRDPHPECPECHGEGIGEPFFHDSRKLSPKARALYGGVKITDKGVEVKVNSRDKALELVGKHVGMFRDKLELTGADGGPVQVVSDAERAILLRAFLAETGESLLRQPAVRETEVDPAS